MSLLKKYRLPLLLWFMCTLYLAFQLIIRLSAGLLREEIMRKFPIDIEAFGAFAGCYYIGYAGMQIPIGILVDKFNLRLIVILCILTTAAGTFLYTLSPSWNIILFARFLVGTGSAVAFLSAAKVIKLYFPVQYQNSLLGATFAIGLLGGVIGGSPMQGVFENLGYNKTFNIITISALIIAFIIFIINDKKMDKLDEHTHDKVNIKNIRKILFSPLVLFIGICGGFMVGSFEGFADVWAIPYFEQIYGFSKSESTFLSISCFYFGMGIGGPILGWIADRMNSPSYLIFLTGLMTCIIFAIMFYFNKINFILLMGLMLILGIAGAYQILAFSIANNLVDKSFAGLMTGMINSLIMAFGVIVHKLMAKTIQFFWNGNIGDTGSPIYVKEVLVYGISVVPLLCAVGMFGFLFLSYYMKGKKLNITL
jgi:predicted MFS family arabinose efflux permease